MAYIITFQIYYPHNIAIDFAVNFVYQTIFSFAVLWNSIVLLSALTSESLYSLHSLNIRSESQALHTIPDSVGRFFIFLIGS